MTNEQAYIEGFCKAAEAAGVDPVALCKAAFDPSSAAGTAALLGGGALAGSAATGDDQSVAKRVGKATIGAGLAYGGYKAMTDPRWQANINAGTQKAMDLIRGLIGRAQAKTASARTVKSADVKRAAGMLDTLIGSGNAPYEPGVLSKLLANEHLRRAAVGAVAGGTTAALTSNRKNRLRNALLAAAGTGLGTYGVSATGALDNLFSYIPELNQGARKAMRDGTAREITRALRGPDKGSLQERFRSEIENARARSHSLTVASRRG